MKETLTYISGSKSLSDPAVLKISNHRKEIFSVGENKTAEVGYT